MKCVLSDSDRRTTGQFVQLVDAQGTDYFENLCLKPTQACKNTRVFQSPRIGVADEKVAQYAGLHYYTDKELQVTSEPACRLACEIESEFLCRSYLYLGQPQGTQYNCRLFHLDHKTLPDGPSTYLNGERPLIDHGEPTGTYAENNCLKPGKIMINVINLRQILFQCSREFLIWILNSQNWRTFWNNNLKIEEQVKSRYHSLRRSFWYHLVVYCVISVQCDKNERNTALGFYVMNIWDELMFRFK